MNPKLIQKYARWLAYIFAGLGICIVLSAIYSFVVIEKGFRWLQSGPLLIIGLALLRASYLVLFRWSRLAIRHLVGGIYFFATILFIPCVMFVQLNAYRLAMDGVGDAEIITLPFAVPITFLGFIVLSYVLYRATAARLSEQMFPQTTTAQ